MINNKITLLALLISMGSTHALAAEPHHDAHAKAPEKAAEKLTEKAPEKAAEKAAEKAQEQAKPQAEVPVLLDAPAKAVVKKKKIRLAKKPASATGSATGSATVSAAVSAAKSAPAGAAHDKPAPVAAADSHHAAPAAVQEDAHGHAAVSTPAPVADKSARPRNRVSMAHAGQDMHALAATSDPHAGAHAAAPAPAPALADAHAAAAPAVAAIAPVNTMPVVEAAAVVESAPLCSPPLKADIAALFERWNASLKTGDAKKVVANYATPSILLPTVSNQARFTAAEKEDYFVHFLQRKPEGRIDDRMIDVDCNSATDAGLYSFKFGDGSVVKARYSFSYRKVDDEWLISSHHSSAMPEKTVVADKQDNPAAPATALERNEPAIKNGGWIRFP